MTTETVSVEGDLGVLFMHNEGYSTMIVESILGSESTFHGKVVGRAKVGPYDAIVPEVSSRAFVTGQHTFIIDKRDELGREFLMP